MPSRKKKNRSQKAIHCAECGRKVKAHNKVDCVCTRVVFCSETCSRLKRNHSDCPGDPNPVAPDPEFWKEFGATMKENPQVKEQHLAQYERYITTSIQELMEEEGQTGSINDVPLKFLIFHAKRGHAACAYRAGELVHHYSIGGTLPPQYTSALQGLGILELDKRSFHLMEQAAEDGIPMAMMQLGFYYRRGDGCRKSFPLAKEWYWRAVLLQGAGAEGILNRGILLGDEVLGVLECAMENANNVGTNKAYSPRGPNIGSLLLAVLEQLNKSNYQLPAFAGTIPPRRVTGSVQQSTTDPVNMVASDMLKVAYEYFQKLAADTGCSVLPYYGRRGCGKVATAVTLRNASRIVENQVFMVPQAPVCDERLVNDINASEWVKSASSGNNKPFGVICIHGENQEDIRIVCDRCVKDAFERLQAVATNSVAISLEEALEQRGQCAIWRTPAGCLKSETFKDYCRAEVECALAAMVLVRRDYDTPIATPLFVAQDPNLYWPIIFHHGSVRAALEHVAPHVDWTEELGPAHTVLPDPIPVETSKFYDVAPNEILRKCGNPSCLKLEPDRSQGSFQRCSRCLRRWYCSRACQEMDFAWHKGECSVGTGKLDPVPKVPNSVPKKLAVEIPSPGEEVVLHGLQSRNELNGKIGCIREALSNADRFSVNLGNSTLAAIKPVNLYRLCVECQTSQNFQHGRKFRCIHSLEECKDCQLDLFIVKALWKRHHLGHLPATAEIEQIIEKVAELHFASLEDNTQEQERSGHLTLDILSDEKKELLQHLLAASDRSETTLVAIVGLFSFAGRADKKSRLHVVSHGEELVRFWANNDAEVEESADDVGDEASA